MKHTAFNLVIAAIFAALICTITLFFPISLPNGFANLGDSFVILSACLLGKYYGAFAAAIGASLADLLLGYVIYAPATFIIKGIMAICSAVIFINLKNKPLMLRTLLACVTSEAIMVLGYFVFEVFVFGYSVAVLDIFGNLLQGVVSVICATLLLVLFSKNSYLKKFFKL